MNDAPLADGTYAAMVVDAVADAESDRLDVELVLVDGPSKGEVVSVQASASLGDPIDLLGMPATLAVRDGIPTLTIDA